MRLDIRIHSDCTVGTGGRVFQFAEDEDGGAWVAMLDQDTTWVR
jgi:hypothetical protein